MTTPPTVSVHAAILVASRKQFEGTVRDAFDRHEAVVVDLTDCPYIDTSGLGVLVSLAKRAQVAGLPFTVTGANEEVQHLFRIAHLDRVFQAAA